MAGLGAQLGRQGVCPNFVDRLFLVVLVPLAAKLAHRSPNTVPRTDFEHVLLIFHMIMYDLHMTLYDLHIILYDFHMISYDFHLIFM